MPFRPVRTDWRIIHCNRKTGKKGSVFSGDSGYIYVTCSSNIDSSQGGSPIPFARHKG